MRGAGTLFHANGTLYGQSLKIGTYSSVSVSRSSPRKFWRGLYVKQTHMANLCCGRTPMILAIANKVGGDTRTEKIPGKKLTCIEDPETGAIVYGVGQSYCERSVIMTGSGHLRKALHRMLMRTRAYLLFLSPIHALYYRLYSFP